ncbi:PREDICTED: ankyrin repeat and BTB/POZ domain-containing protein 1-like [Priapulus caudatus]|uniref:Ankyrin repeat and BTB/POZ domain-containing protein 1-like n=1 Tax=Priapulus caudatus TaxID=37621 RepID=A0ABM1F173_PRICU|nr:PREDICTED: ankyrin repeat and BTB/POZ domain-containing protein 1-like [Priapulus caudatus]
MDQRDLFLSCRRGDLEHVTYLVEQLEVELNIRDRWDSTPLYYACLCGHSEVVHYLLIRGAKCEANTFDGERCLYGALNDDIRNMLKNYKVITAQCMRRDSYQEFLRRLLEDATYADVWFVVHGERFAGHRCILSARSQYFAEMFMDRWQQRSIVHITHPLVRPAAFRLMLQYLYMGSLEVHVDQVESVIVLAKQCHLVDLIDELEARQRKLREFLAAKPGTSVTMVTVEASEGGGGGCCATVAGDLGMLAEQALPAALARWVSGSELPFYPSERSPFADVCFVVDGHRFACHRALFCGRSDYFRAVLADHFGEGCGSDGGAPVVALRSVSAAVFVAIVYYVYTDGACVADDVVCEVLTAADMLLLPGLKRQCGARMALALTLDNVVDVLRTARLFQLSRMEVSCTEFIATHLESVVEMTDFHRVIESDAASVKARQETDTIDIVDDVR